METGGYSIFMPNSGNKDYQNVGEKCLLYKLWDLNSEAKCIEKSILNELLQQKLFIFVLINLRTIVLILISSKISINFSS